MGVAARRAVLFLSTAVGSLIGEAAPAQVPQVQPTVETDPVPSSGDAADDPAIWVHPVEPALSRLIGTDKDLGLGVYDLSGHQVQFLADGRLNNVDVRYGFQLDGAPVDIVAAGNRSDDTIAVYRVDPGTGLLSDVTGGPIEPGVSDTYGFCLYRSALTGQHYFFVNDQSGDVEQWRLFDGGRGVVEAAFVRGFAVGSQTEGMVADDAFGWLYVGEENVGIWRYGAEPDAGPDRVQVDSTGPGGHLTADVEGLAMYYTGDGAGYLLASSQGSSEFVVYQRAAPNAYVTTFEVGSGGGIDGVTGTDGIDVISVPLGPEFPLGLFIAQDNSNSPDNQNFKVVPWQAIAGAGGGLIVDTAWDPRAPPGDQNHDGAIGTIDFLAVLVAWGPCSAPCPADINGDGAVSIVDLLIVLANWG